MDAGTSARITTAIEAFWGVRAAQLTNAQNLQGGTRSAVTRGKHLDAVNDLLAAEFMLGGFSRGQVHNSGRAKTMPGYFRPTKN